MKELSTVGDPDIEYPRNLLVVEVEYVAQEEDGALPRVFDVPYLTSDSVHGGRASPSRVSARPMR
jgi:hypothetical protein